MATPSTVSITAIGINLLECLNHSLDIKLSVDQRRPELVVLKRKKEQIGRRFHQLSRILELSGGSTLTVRIERGPQYYRALKRISPLNLSLNDLYHNPYILDDGKRQLWLSFHPQPHLPPNSPGLPERPSDVPPMAGPYPSENPPPLPPKVVNTVKSAIDSFKLQLEKFTSALNCLAILTYQVTIPIEAFGTRVVELNLVAHTVQRHFNSYYEQINARGEGHEKIKALTESMAATVDHIQLVHDLAELKGLIIPLKKFIDIMRETVVHFSTWVEQGVPAKVTLLRSYIHRVDDLERRYSSFKTEFDRFIRIDRERSLLKHRDLEELKTYLFEDFKMVEPRADECIPGTRVKILADIESEINKCDNMNVIWIRGGPGSGKSTITSTIKSRLQEQGRLVTYFRFDRNGPTATTSAVLWRRVAYDLARRLPSVRRRLLQQFRNRKVNLSSSALIFNNLVYGPLSKSTEPPPDQPLAIVIDALDECDVFVGSSSEDCRALLQTMRRWPDIRNSKYFKLVVASREDGDIMRVLSNISTPIEIRSGHNLTENPRNETSIHASNDIRIFLENRFERVRDHIPSLPTDWPGNRDIGIMVDRAAGVFMWATAAVKFIDCPGADPRSRLEMIIHHSPGSGSMKPLYDLYTIILKMSFDNLKDWEKDRVRSVLGVMVIAQRPLADMVYLKLPISQPVTEDMLHTFRNGLRSVIFPGDKLRFAHRSFDDFLVSEECPFQYRIQTTEAHSLLTHLCLQTMATALHFNMCSLETSFLKNPEGPQSNFENQNHSFLSYSCKFWADHLRLTPVDVRLVNDVKEMIFDKLLYWFEAMSLLKEINRVPRSLSLVLEWSHSSPDAEFTDFIQDARRFIGMFGQPIAESAPHIYISALPFAPRNSLVARCFLPRFPRTLACSTGKLDDWPLCIYTSEHHKFEANSVAFSPDSEHFASGSSDKTLCICDSETGIRVSGPFEHGSGVLRVSFDPEGKRVWAGCGDKKVEGNVVGWNVETGDKHKGFQVGSKMDRIFCACFHGGQKIVSTSKRQGIVTLWDVDTGERRDLLKNAPVDIVSFSPDGRHLACARSDDKAITLWNLAAVPTKIRDLSQSPPRYTHSQPISALSFSVDGNFVVSGSTDGTILIWDVNTGNTLKSPLSISTGWLDAVAYSPKAKLVICASSTAGRNFSVVTVWDISTSRVVLGPLEGHTLWITEIVLSYDGERALSASWDGTVRMWDIGARRNIHVETNVDKGHDDIPGCVVFSPSGAELASLGRDKTIRFWDPKNGGLLKTLNTDSDYNQIIFSPDGREIVAYSSTKNSVQSWSVDTSADIFRLDLRDNNQVSTQVELLAFRTKKPARQSDYRLVTCSRDGILHVRSSENGTMIEQQSLQLEDGAKFVALSPDSLSVVVRDNNKNLRHYVWSTTRDHWRLSPPFDDREFLLGQHVVYSPSGTFFATTYNPLLNDKSTLRIWDTKTGKPAASPLTLNGVIGCLAFSPDNHHIVFSHPRPPNSDIISIHAWDTQTCQLLPGSWKGHTDCITTLAFSADGKILVSGSKDGQIRIWNTDHILGNLQVSDGFSGVGTHMQDGWVTDTAGNLLFWVPKDHRAKLVWPGNIAVIGHRGITMKLDLDSFRYGDKWMECCMEEEEWTTVVSPERE